MNDLKNKKKLKYLLVGVSILLFFGFSFYLLIYLGPEQIIEFVGVENAYLLIFVTAIFGGFTTFNIIPYHPLLITLAAGGLNPFILGVLAATGVSLGDSTSYLIGYGGRTILPETAGDWFQRIHSLAVNHPKMFMSLSFIYSSIIPTSNDFITIPAGLARLPFWKVMIPLFLGNVVFDISLAYFAPQAYVFLQGIFL